MKKSLLSLSLVAALFSISASADSEVFLRIKSLDCKNDQNSEMSLSLNLTGEMQQENYSTTLTIRIGQKQKTTHPGRVKTSIMFVGNAIFQFTANNGDSRLASVTVVPDFNSETEQLYLARGLTEEISFSALATVDQTQSNMNCKLTFLPYCHGDIDFCERVLPGGTSFDSSVLAQP